MIYSTNSALRDRFARAGLTFKIEIILGAILLAFALFALLCGSGCQTRLAPGGVYTDPVLYDADNAIVEGHQILQDFVNWEASYRAALSPFPQIKQLADRIYTEGPQWFASANTLRDAYAANPSSDTKGKLTTGLEVLRAAIREATGYLASNKSLAPPVMAPTVSTNH